MTIYDDAATALVHAQAAAVPRGGIAYLRCRRTAVGRDITTLLGVSPAHVVVTDDARGDLCGNPTALITVHDPDDATSVLRFIPETSNNGTGGGAYLLLRPCPGCSDASCSHDVPLVTVANLADLGRYLHANDAARTDPNVDVLDVIEVPAQFYGDPAHARDCPLA